jgi:ABC-type bacteriocin/lantibiotic exporter with double-glycine peptidase domain
MIQDAMAKLMKGRTSFVIAYRLSTIRDADLILVMKRKGRMMDCLRLMVFMLIFITLSLRGMV